ncbi:amino acid adenylation domain-containing protein [Vibrio atypicus]|uniref:amino acid adenylation domain-containing protein n=1 Tax=Vibrio atypicus TaxID=558271 RepID=UPI0037365C4E
MHAQDAREERCPLIGTQQGIWFAQQVMPNPEEFNVAHYVEIEGDIDLDKFANAVKLGIEAADSLHCRYVEIDGEVRQLFSEQRFETDALEVLDFSEAADAQQSALNWMEQDLAGVIDLESESPRYRHALIYVGESEAPKWLWYQRYHHIDVDGFSFNSITHYIVSTYNHLTKGAPLPEPLSSFKEVALEHQAYLQSEQHSKAKDYWLGQAKLLPEPISLTTGGRNLEAQGIEKLTIELAGGEWLNREGNKILPSELAMALVFAYLHQQSNQKCVCVGFPFMRRMGSSAISSSGAVVNVLPVAVDIDSSMTIVDIAKAMNKAIRQARRHQMYDAEQIQRDIGKVGQPLYGPILNFKPFEDDLELAGARATTHILSAGPIDDIEFSPQLNNNQVSLTLTASATKYSQHALDLHLQRFAFMVEQVACNPDIALQELMTIPPSEQDLISDWSHGRSQPSIAGENTVIDLFERQLEQKPNAMALHFGGQVWSFAELGKAVKDRAHKIQALGASKGDIVGVALPRSPDTIITMLAILRSGATYLPIDLGYPQERIETIIEQAQPWGVIVTEGESLSWLSATRSITLNELNRCKPDKRLTTEIYKSDVAYIVFTSGSTGKPKGVMNTHGALLNLLHSHQESIFAKAIGAVSLKQQVSEKEVQIRAAHTTSFSFDASWEQVIWMLCGHTLYLYDDEQRKDAYELCERVVQDKINALDLPPSLFSQMLDNSLMEAEHVPSLVLIGSEAVPEQLWSRVKAFPDLHVENFYGPTEFTVDAVSAPLTSDDTPVIGRPILNAKAYVLDQELNRTAVGVAGELYLAGAGLAKGYLNQAGMTAERFVANPFEHGQIMYRSGDLVKWRDNGQLDFIGRSDDQVKIRGFRIELGDVESAINAIDGVDTTVVIAERHADSHRLLAYCTLTNDAKTKLDEAALLALISSLLPEYMVPAALIVLDAFSLNLNGKIDRKALPKPVLSSDVEWVAPANEQEEVLCNAVGELLGAEQVGSNDDFFNLGGDSISAMGLGTLLRKAGYELRPREIFAARKIDVMAALMKPLQSQVTVSQDGEIQPLPMWQWFEETFSVDTSYVQGVFVEVEPETTLLHLQAALKQLVSKNSACRLIKDGVKYLIESIDKLDPSSWAASVAVNDLADANLDDLFERSSQKLSLSTGQLIQLVLVNDEMGNKGLMILAHHLIIDGVSWRILLPQLRALTRAQVTGDSIEIAGEVTGLNTWSKALHQHVTEINHQVEMWRERETRTVEPLKVVNKQGAIVHERVLLTADITEKLLSQSQTTAAIDIDELLITSVTSVLGDIYQKDSIKLNLESHGREEFDSTLNLTQTLGWFTTEYPLVIDVASNGISDLLKEVKQAKRSIKDNGLGYMSLKYLENPYRDEFSLLAKRNKASLLFNYLGRFEKAEGTWAPITREGKFADTFAVALDGDQTLLHDLELNIFVDESKEKPQLALNWAWDNAQFDHHEIASICQGIEQKLEQALSWLSSSCNAEMALKVPAEYTQESITLSDAALLAAHYGTVSDVLPALPLQEGLLFQSQLGDENSNYNSMTRLTFQGEVKQQCVQQALNAVIARHPQLLAKFDSLVLGHTIQLIPAQLTDWPMQCLDLRNQSIEQQQSYLAQVQKEELVRQFDLNNPEESLLNATLIYHGQDISTLLISAHHLVVDGWSTPILLRDFLTAYSGVNSELSAVSAKYSDVVSQLKQRDKTPAQQLWREVLQDVNPNIAFEDVPLNDEVKEHELTIDKETTQRLSQLLRRSGLTMNSLMQGIWSSILGSMTGREDVVFGTPISGRFGHAKGIDEHIGLFSNTIPVRMKLNAKLSLLEQLKAHQETQIQLLEHDELGLGEIQQLAGGETLFDTLLVVENYPDHSDWYQQDYQGAQLIDIHNRGYTHYPLTILVLPGEQVHILFEYRDTSGVAEKVMRRFEKVLQTVIDFPDLPLTQLDLRLNEEIELQRCINHTSALVCNTTLRHLMAEQALKTPNNLALVDSEQAFSYQEMRHQVNGFANLLAKHHVGVGDIVAVALPRSVKLSLAFNSIIECGGAYLPLDVSYPDERLAYMINDAKPKLIITTSEYQERFSHLGELLILDQLPEPSPFSEVSNQESLTAEHGAYIIYTSGSTGNPKGVLVSHKAIVNRLQWMQFEYQLAEHDVVLQKTPCSFDVSVWEFFWPLIQGSTLAMAPAESHKDPEWLMQVIDDFHVTTMHFVPSMLAAFMASIDSNTEAGSKVATSLKRVFCSGEALSKELSNEYAKWIDAPLHNLYGPTEAAVDVTYCPAFGEPLEESLGTSVPIGLPVWNTQVYVLDSFLRETPIGVPGELYLAGDQLAIGYLNRSSLTADRFIASPFGTGERMYRTGDVVRWLPSGKIEYLGRSDDQLKIRGQRIELGEIETALQALPDVKQALVCAKALGSEKKMAGADDRQLVGYVILNDGAQMDGAELKAMLAEHLPAHMVPIAVIILDDFPLSANGKLDRKALPLPSDIATGEGRKARPGLEAQLAAIFAEVLELETLSAEDDFFALGGHSLMAMKLAADIRRVLNMPVTVGQIMVNPTVEKLTLLLLDEDALKDPTQAGFGTMLPIRAGDGPALFCINSGSGFAWQYTGLPKFLDGLYPIVGLQSPDLSGAITTAQDMQEACEIYFELLKEIQPEGPYHLLGYSFGGNVAQHLAAKLEQNGDVVGYLGLLDTYPPEGQDWEGPMSEEEENELEREKAQFLASNDVTDDALDQQRLEMFQTIVSNYEGAIRLLSGANSPRYSGQADLFVAQKTVPDGYDIDQHWQSFIGGVEKLYFDCSHEDIIAPDNVAEIGKQLNKRLNQTETLKS